MTSLTSKAPNKSARRAAYVYPNIPVGRMGSGNPYIERLKDALRAEGMEVTATVSGNAFADLVRKGHSADVVILNWLEDLPSRRLGVLQSFILMPYLFLIRLRGTSLIWIKHNKVSHTQRLFGLRKMIQRFLQRHADHIIVHARDEEMAGAAKAVFLPHPCTVTPEEILAPDETMKPEIDLLIWGSLQPYKGVLEFLQSVEKDALMQTLRIHIVGKCSPEYWHQLKEHAGRNVTLVNTFISEDEIRELFSRTRFIVFTYNKKSVLSSGVLMDSLVACKRMFAPDCGAFRDMAEEQRFVTLFSDISEIPGLYRDNVDNFILDRSRVSAFVAQNSWNNMAGYIGRLLARSPTSLYPEITLSEPTEISS
ncbi:MAG TPA: hypothetical protein VGN00_15155 [Puia sp.]|jgi:hypothetical protein